MSIYNILVQFPNHHFIGTVTLDDNWESSAKRELITTFTYDGSKEICHENKELLAIFAEFFDFGAKYFEKGELNGEDVAAKLRLQLGELYLGNRAKSNYSYHFTGVWPHSINFGDLCYSSDPTVHLEVTWKYKTCEICDIIRKQDDDQSPHNQPSVLP